MKALPVLFFIILLMPAGYAQPIAGDLAYDGGSRIDQEAFIFIGSHDNLIHLVWDAHTRESVEWYVVEQSFDGSNFLGLDSIRPEELFDIFANDYPEDIEYDNRVLYSTETGSGRFIYNDILAGDELSEKNLWYRIKIRAESGIIYTKTVFESFEFGTGLDETAGGTNSTTDHFNVFPAQLTGDGGQDTPENNENNHNERRRRTGCPSEQTPPAGYIPTGLTKTYYGDCCYWEESEFIQQQITAPCGTYQAWCCSFDCTPPGYSTPLAYDPCCVHICSEYNQCSCHPWICCDFDNATIWIVTTAVDYVIGATITDKEDVSCYGEADGSVTITLSGGLQPITYLWSNGSQTGSAFTGLSGGTYSLTITDDIGCEETLTFVINEEPELISSMTTYDIDCYGDNSGVVDLSVSGGVPPYTYLWNPGSYATQDLNNVGPGNYSVTVTDDDGCQVFNGTSLSEPAEFTGVVSTTNISCFGWNTGTAVLTVSGGTAPPTYIWSNGVDSFNNSGLVPGTYYVTATDANGCSFSTSTTITENPEITASISTTNSVCGSCTGSASITASGGTPPYTYNWNTVSGTSSNLCGGTYNVEVIDADVPGCSRTFAFSISENGAQALSTSKTNVTCYGSCNASATVTFTGGCTNPPCTIEWFESPFGASTGQTAATATGLCKGDYLVQVTNGAGCLSSATVTITEPLKLTGNLTVTHESCNNACDGSISASISGGTGAYSYQWLNGSGNIIPGQVSSSILNRCPGDYTLRVTDANSCVATFDATIADYMLAATINSTNIDCYADCNGTIEVVASGGTRPFSYQWLDGSGTSIPSQTSPVITNLCAGNYSVQITDAGGVCSITTPVTTITEPLELSVLLSVTDVACAGDCNGSVTATISGGSPAYDIQWYDYQSVPISGAVSNNLTNQCAGTYYIKVSDDNNCSTGFLPATINQVSNLMTSVVITNISCNGMMDGSIDLTVTGGVMPYTFDWAGLGATSEDVSSLGAGTYTVIITDDNGCTATESATIVEPQPITPTITPFIYSNGYNLRCPGATDAKASVAATGGTAPYTYQWNDPAAQVSATAIGLALGNYTVTVTDSRNCTATTSINLSLDPPPYMTSLDVTDPFCNGDSSGTINLTVSGGTPPFVYRWDNGVVFVEDLTGLPAGQYAVNVVDTANGCIIRDTAVITEPAALSLTQQQITICDDDSIFLAGDFQTAAGTYYDTLFSINNCDSIIETQLFTVAELVTPVSVTICSNDSFYAGGAFQNTPGLYYDTLLASIGCDSIIITDLMVDPTYVDTTTAEIFSYDSIFLGGAFQNTSGAYYDSLTSVDGCDSTIVTLLEVIPLVKTSISVTICEYDSFYIGNSIYYQTGVYEDTLTAAGGFDSIVTTNLLVEICPIQINIRAFLGGPYKNNTKLMDDGLRVNGFIPLNEPYTAIFNQVFPGGGETINPNILLVTGDSAIVDWIFVELRHKNNSDSVLATRSALIQRNGHVVDLDGISNISFGGAVKAGEYYVSVKHRNHFGVMTATPYLITSKPTTIDFTVLSTPTYGTNAQNIATSRRIMWAGNVLLDNLIKYSGLNNDRDPILQKIGGVVPTNVVLGYFSEDVSMDGVVKYSGFNNDRDIILVNIGGIVPTAVLVEQLP